jgi:Pyridoxamine 5'-phosphate oxidase
MRWAEFEAAEPEFASRVRAMLTRRKHLTLATVRSDGSPRISGTEIGFEDGELIIGSMPGAVKGHDLRRDARVAIHGPTEDPPASEPAAWAGEAKIAGHAVAVESAGQGDRFQIDVREAVITHLDEAATRLVIESWNETRGYRKIERE